MKWVVPWAPEDYPQCKADYHPTTHKIQGCAAAGSEGTLTEPGEEIDLTTPLTQQTVENENRVLLIVLAVVGLVVFLAVSFLAVQLCTGKKNGASPKELDDELSDSLE